MFGYDYLQYMHHEFYTRHLSITDVDLLQRAKQVLQKKRDSIYIQLCAAGNDNKHMKRSERGGTFATSTQSPEEAEIIKMSQSKTFGGSIKAHPHNTDLKKKNRNGHMGFRS